MLSRHGRRPGKPGAEGLATTYATRYATRPVPRDELPEEQMPAHVAARLVRDEMNLDGNPALNLASFVTTWMEPEAAALMADTVAKNYADADEYPQTAEIESRCVNMLARLFHAPPEGGGVGTATVGSTEAIHLAGLAMKWRWRRRREAEGRPADRPNFVVGHDDQVAWEKFARYFEVEPRYVPLTDERFVLGVPEALERVDENTIGVVGILGSTYTGEYEPIRELSEALSAHNDRTGWQVPIHVDAAGGGFVAPFTEPDLAWDFRLPLVRSINVSGHKYGLVYPGLGWVVWREAADLPAELVFHVSYLGGEQPTLSLNFSRGASQIVAQYYNFLRLGRAGYAQVMTALQGVAAHLREAIARTGHFALVGSGRGLPLACFRLVGKRAYDEYDVSEKLRERDWIVPAYPLAPDADHVTVLRVVVREGFSRDMADLLADDLVAAVGRLDRLPPRTGGAGGGPAPPRPAPKTARVC